MSGTRALLVGTTKGLFLIRNRESSGDWAVDGPHCDLWPINHAIGDDAALWAAGGSDWEGAGVWRSTDGGATWTLSKLANGEVDEWRAANPDIAASLGLPVSEGNGPFSGKISALWSLGRANGTLYTGAKPAALYASQDGGETWTEVESVASHPSAETWNPGAAGLTLHTIVANPGDPQRMWLGISAAGVFGTEDGGATWERLNRRSNSSPAIPSTHPAAGSDTEIGHCVHNIVRADTDEGDLLYQQNHHGVFRSHDGGRSWHEITPGLPSTFGFPVAVNPHNPDMLWTIPLNGDSVGRYPPDAAAAVWRSTDGGDTWEAQRTGLPQEGCYFTVLRQAMATDDLDPSGVYFGTNSGSVFATTDHGETWIEIARHLPTVLSVEAVGRA